MMAKATSDCPSSEVSHCKQALSQQKQNSIAKATATSSSESKDYNDDTTKQTKG